MNAAKVITNTRVVGSLYRLAVSKARQEIKFTCRIKDIPLKEVPPNAAQALAEEYLQAALRRLWQERPGI
jgi:hypothetical protein